MLLLCENTQSVNHLLRLTIINKVIYKETPCVIRKQKCGRHQYNSYLGHMPFQ